MDKRGFSLVEVVFSMAAIGLGVGIVNAGIDLSFSQGKIANTATSFQNKFENFKSSSTACESLVGQNVSSIDTSKIAANFSEFKNLNVKHETVDLGSISGGSLEYDLKLKISAENAINVSHTHKLYTNSSGVIEECSSYGLNTSINNSWKNAGLDISINAGWKPVSEMLQFQMCEKLLKGICDASTGFDGGFGSIVAANELGKDKIPGHSPTATSPKKGIPLGDDVMTSEPYGKPKNPGKEKSSSANSGTDDQVASIPQNTDPHATVGGASLVPQSPTSSR